MHPLRKRLVWVLTLIVFLVSTADAHVTRVEIVSREDVQGGRAFGLAGAYEKIVGRVYFAVSPENVHNRQIVDLDKTPRNAQGEVEFSADLHLYKPKDMNKGNGAVLFEVSNRGGRGILRLVDGGTSSDANGEFGDGFLLREGYTIVWLGWQFDLAEDGQKVRLSPPVAHDPGGKEIRGLVRSDFTPSQKTDDMPLGHILLVPSGGKSYPADDPASTKNVLTVRDAPEGQRQSIPRSQWSFAHSMDGVIAHVAGAGRGSFNHRFAQPSRDAQPLSSFLCPTDLFPYTDLPENGPETGETAGLLDAANRSRTAPKIFFTNTSYEYWGR